MLKFLNKKVYKPKDISSPRRFFGISAGTYVNPDSAKQVAAFHRGLVYISTQMAKLPVEIKNRSNEIQDDHILSVLLNVAPNDETDAFTFKTWWIQQAILYGNGYAEIERDFFGVPKAIHPIDSQDVCPLRASDGSLVYRINGGSTLTPGEDAYLRPMDILHLRNFISKDTIIGDGVVAYAMTTLGITLGADGFANDLYANGGLPSGVLTVPGTLDDDSFDRLKASWEAGYSGGRKVGKTAILEEGTTFNPVTFQPDVLQFLESRKFGVVEIARFLGLPPTKLFDTDSAQYKNIEHANLEVATDTLDAWARNIESQCDFKLLNKRKGGLRTELEMFQVFRGDMLTRSTYYQKMMQNGAITSNQIRVKEGMSPYKEGDRYYIATNNFTPIDRMDEVIDASIQPKNNTVENDYTDDKEVNDAVVSYLKSKTKS